MSDKKKIHLPSRELCNYFNAPIFDTCTLACGNSRALHGVYYRTRGTVAHGTAGLVIGSRIEACGIRRTRKSFRVRQVVCAIGKIVCVSVEDSVGANDVRGQGRGDVKVSVGRVRII